MIADTSALSLLSLQECLLATPKAPQRFPSRLQDTLYTDCNRNLLFSCFSYCFYASTELPRVHLENGRDFLWGWSVMQNLRTNSLVNHPEVRPIDRKEVNLDERKTLRYYSKYEYTALLATRAQQLADGARPLVSLEGILPGDPLFVWKVAEKEILEQRLPFLVNRRMPDGKSEFWSTQELEKMW